MEIHLNVFQDSHNSHPTAKMLINVPEDSELVYFQLSDNSREWAVSKKELQRVLSIVTMR